MTAKSRDTWPRKGQLTRGSASAVHATVGTLAVGAVAVGAPAVGIPPPRVAGWQAAAPMAASSTAAGRAQDIGVDRSAARTGAECPTLARGCTRFGGATAIR